MASDYEPSQSRAALRDVLCAWAIYAVLLGALATVAELRNDSRDEPDLLAISPSAPQSPTTAQKQFEFGPGATVVFAPRSLEAVRRRRY